MEENQMRILAAVLPLGLLASPVYAQNAGGLGGGKRRAAQNSEQQKADQQKKKVPRTPTRRG
jgi:hypothetical protein